MTTDPSTTELIWIDRDFDDLHGLIGKDNGHDVSLAYPDCIGPASVFSGVGALTRRHVGHYPDCPRVHPILRL